MPTPLLTRLPAVQTPNGLDGRVMDAIVAAQCRRVRIRFGFSLAGMVSSIAVAAAYRVALWNEVASSSFFAMLRLVVSDPDVAFGNAKELALGLLENIPLGTVTLALVGIFCAIAVVGFAQALRHVRRFPLMHKTLSLN